MSKRAGNGAHPAQGENRTGQDLLATAGRMAATGAVSALLMTGAARLPLAVSYGIAQAQEAMAEEGENSSSAIEDVPTDLRDETTPHKDDGNDERTEDVGDSKDDAGDTGNGDADASGPAGDKNDSGEGQGAADDEQRIKVVTISCPSAEGKPRELVSEGVFGTVVEVEFDDEADLDWEGTALLLYEHDKPEITVQGDEGQDAEPSNDKPSDEEQPGEDPSDDGQPGNKAPDDGKPSDDPSSEEEPGDEPSSDEPSSEDDEHPSENAQDADESDNDPVRVMATLSDEDESVSRIRFTVPEGRFAYLAFDIHDADGQVIEAPAFEDVVFDSTKPRGKILLGKKECSGSEILSEPEVVSFVIGEANPLLDESGAMIADAELRDLTHGRTMTADAWALDEEPDVYVARIRAGELADGKYQATLRCVDAAGNEMDPVVRTFWVDTQAPSISIDAKYDGTSNVDGNTVHCNDVVTLDIRIRDAHLDEARTTVLGMSLEELLASEEGVESREPDYRCVATSVKRDAERLEEATVRVVLREGALALDDLAQAYDRADNQAMLGTLGPDVPVTQIVVDRQAPRVEARVSSEPQGTYDTEQGMVAFFGSKTSLELSFEDEGGIASVEMVSSADRTDPRMEVRAERSGAVIELGQGPLDDALAIEIADLAGNVTRWSLSEKGQVTTAAGTQACANAPLRAPSGDLVALGHPALLIEDTTAPQVRVLGIDEGACSRDAVRLGIEVEDAYLGYLAEFDPNQAVASVYKDGNLVSVVHAGYDKSDLLDERHVYEIEAPARSDHQDDGAYEVVAQVEDLSGNRSAAARRSFVVDTTSPVIEVTFEDGIAHTTQERRFFSSERTAHVELVEHNMTLEELNGRSPLVRVLPEASLGRDSSEVVVTPWQETDVEDTFACTVTFPVDATYKLAIEGCDRAGNLLVGTDETVVDETGRYESDPFVIDATEPRVTIRYTSIQGQPTTYEGLEYFRKPVSVNVEVTDRNLDTAHAVVSTSDGKEIVPSWSSSEPDENGEVTYTATLLYMEEGTGTGAGRKLPVATVGDLAGNATTMRGAAFVVDQTAPVVDGVAVSKDPAAREANPDEDPYWFYNERDGVAAAITMRFSDEYGIDKAWVIDPDGVYAIENHAVRGNTSGSITLRLKDYDEAGASANTEWERDVLLHVRDLAGNLRVWSLNRRGEIVADRDTGAQNASIDASGMFPLALVKDVVAPALNIQGVETGAYYRDPQTAHVTVNEHNFGYLQQFDPSRVAVTVEVEAGREGGSHSSWTVPVREFKGTAPFFGTDVACEADGHYTIVARLTDIARNESSEVRVGSFTVDRTAPVISVAWDNEDVRNGMYYNAPRTATITVTEHNFDANLFSIQTTGRVGGWSSSGDTHTCQVEFSSDVPPSSPHTLVVSGSDKAGNEAQRFEAPPFVIDTKAPTVSILKRVSGDDPYELEAEQTELLDGSAFARGIMPLVVCEDDANLDRSSVQVSIVGKRPQEKAASLWESRTQASDNREVVDWGNIGLSEGGDGPYYLVEADDVYTLTAQVSDLAGNVAQQRSVVFSVNRYGSNFFVEPLYAQASEGAQDNAVMLQPPRIVVHEVNVSGAASELGEPEDESHWVTKEYANATHAIAREEGEEPSGYALTSSSDTSVTNPYEGWTEYVYTIREGNFGKGSSSDFGDGGQGLYRVDVSSKDKASHHNTTSRFWESGASRAEEIRDKTATVSFMLDEFGPSIENLDVPGTFEVGGTYDASFRLVDEISEGDYLSVLVDGEPVPVYREGSSSPLDESGLALHEGTYYFTIPARHILAPRTVEVRASDYTGRADRTKEVRAKGFHLTTMVAEGLVGLGIAAFVMVVIAVVYRMQLVA